LLGYTNWTNAGILKYHLSTKQIVWRHKRKFEGPQGRYRIYKEGNRVFWVKNGTELICLDVETGDELYALRTSPWLYTDLQFCQNLILYGTAGADGYFNVLDIETGKLKWSAFLKDGCAYYDIYKDSVLFGDWTKTVKQFSITDGKFLQTLPLDAEVVGRILVSDGYIYTIVWGNETKGVRLIQAKI
jgi:outer membrane protein assembly factor BamB